MKKRVLCFNKYNKTRWKTKFGQRFQTNKKSIHQEKNYIKYSVNRNSYTSRLNKKKGLKKQYGNIIQVRIAEG